MSEPLVSVIMPVFRSEEFIEHAIHQVLQQTHTNFELLVVDDASDDSTAGRATAASGNDPRVRILHNAENQGPTMARSNGLSQARGEYVWLVDCDDLWEPTMLERLVATASSHQCDLVVCRADRTELNGRISLMEGVEQLKIGDQSQLARWILDGTVRGFLWNKLFRKEVLRPTVREHLTSQDDFLMLLDALPAIKRCAVVPDLLYHYHDRPNSVTHSSRLKLHNVAVCHQIALRVVGPLTRLEQPAHLTDYFTCWFLLLPVLTTPAHQGWPNEERALIRSEFGPQLRLRHVQAAMRHRPLTAAHAAALWVLRRLFDPAYRAFGRIAGFSIRELDRSSSISAGP